MKTLLSSRLLRLFVVLVGVGILSACEVDLDVLVTVEEDGSGEVVITLQLDEAASQRIPDLGAQLELGDLEQAGWTVEGPATAEDGTVTMTFRRPFVTVEEANGVLRGLTGEEGPFKRFELDRDRSFARTSVSFSGQIDVASGCEEYGGEPGCALAAFADAEVSELLDGQPFGGQLVQIANDTAADPDDQVTIDLSVVVPGDQGTWTVDWGAVDPQELSVGATQWRSESLALAGASAFFFVVGLISFLARAGWADEARRPKTIGAEAAEAEGYYPDEEDDWVEGAEAIPTEGGSDRSLQLLVLDATSMLFAIEDPSALLADFAKQKGSSVSAGDIAGFYDQARIGELSSGELWDRLGLKQDPGALTDEYLAAIRLRKGVRDFLERMRTRGLPVACAANDIGEWSRRLRATHKLEHLTAAWITSGDVHQTLPGPGILERISHATGIEPGNSFFLSADVVNLDAARTFGCAAARLVDEGADDEEGAYPIITSLDDLGLD